MTAAGGGATINGDLGVSPGTSITGFPPATVVPPYAIHNNDGPAISAQAAAGTLFTFLQTAGPSTPIANQLNGQNLGPGVYSLGAADLAAGGTLTLNGAGVYIFQVASSLTANVGSTVSLLGVNPCNVFWQVTSSATLNGANFAGTVVAQASVTLGVGATLTGRALARTGAVTMAGGNTVGGCAGAPAPPPSPPGLSISKTHTGNFVVGTNGTFTIRVTNTGGVPTSGVVTVTDTLPAGLTFVSGVGTGWSCSAAGQTVTCTTSTPIPAGGAASPITLTVNPQASAVGTRINTVSVTGGGTGRR